jgi:hypothetical protein
MSESSKTDKVELPFFTKEEISQHNTPEDNWMCINGLVYNFTGFENEHPGGKECKFFFFFGLLAFKANSSKGSQCMQGMRIRPKSSKTRMQDRTPRISFVTVVWLEDWLKMLGREAKLRDSSIRCLAGGGRLKVYNLHSGLRLLRLHLSPEEEGNATVLEAKSTTDLDDAQRSASGEVVIW